MFPDLTNGSDGSCGSKDLNVYRFNPVVKSALFTLSYLIYLLVVLSLTLSEMFKATV